MDVEGDFFETRHRLKNDGGSGVTAAARDGGAAAAAVGRDPTANCETNVGSVRGDSGPSVVDDDDDSDALSTWRRLRTAFEALPTAEERMPCGLHVALELPSGNSVRDGWPLEDADVATDGET